MKEVLIELGLKQPVTAEDMKRYLENMKNTTISYDWGNKYASQRFEESRKRFIESREKLRVALTEVAPDVNGEKFINTLITSPIKINQLNFNSIVNLIINLETTAVKKGNADIKSLIVVSQPQEEVAIDSGKFLEIFSLIFTVVFTIINQFQTYQTNLQLNRMEDQLQHQSEQIESIFEQYIEEHQEKNVEIPDFINELNGYDYGTRT